MNAPAMIDHLAEPQVELLPLGNICPSETHIQAERRKRYDAAALEELAASIRETGVLQPVVVRPLAALRGLAKYELVAGERRWRAAEKADQHHILARILPLTDAQVLRAQLVENLQREGLDPLAEAQGYRDLMAEGVNADAIAAMIGKSRSYVYARLKLLNLAPPVRDALNAGELKAEQALLFARLPAEKLQERALDTLRKWDYQGHGERLSFRRTAEILKDKGSGLLLPLARVPFALDDATYHVFGPKQGRGQAQDVVPLPPCTECPKRSGNDAELLAALEDPDVCTDRLCHDAKAKQALERRRAEAEASGREILKGDAAAEILPTQYGTRGWLDLDAECDDVDFPEPEPEQAEDESEEAWQSRMDDFERAYERWQRPSYRQLLGEQVSQLDIKLVQDPRSKRLRELAPDKRVAALLKEQGHKIRLARDERPAAAAKPKDPEAAKRHAEKEAHERAERELEDKIDEEIRVRILQEIYIRWKGPLKRDDLELVAELLMDDYDIGETVRELWGRLATKAAKVIPAAMNERDLGRLIVVAVLSEGWNAGGGGLTLRAAAKRLKIDADKIRKQVRAELAPKPEASAAAKKPAAKAKGKKK